MNHLSQPDELEQIVQQIMGQALPEVENVAALVSGFESLVRNIQTSLEPVLGLYAVRVLISQAIRRAAESYSFLDSVTVHEDGINAENILTLKMDSDHQEVRAAFAAVVGAVLHLLTSLLGQQLALALLNDVIDPP